jgi:hypothetical protein
MSLFPQINIKTQGVYPPSIFPPTPGVKPAITHKGKENTVPISLTKLLSAANHHIYNGSQETKLPSLQNMQKPPNKSLGQAPLEQLGKKHVSLSISIQRISASDSEHYAEFKRDDLEQPDSNSMYYSDED